MKRILKWELEKFMPCDMIKYPDNWPDIRRSILLRSGGRSDDPRVGAKCEWCGVRNYSIGHRNTEGIFIPARGNVYYDDYKYATSYGEAKEAVDHVNEWCDQSPKHIIIVLTIAHLDDPNPQNVELSNLAALCQRCHNRYDRKMRRMNAAKTKYEKIIKNDQIELFSLREK
jgi:hypothetical protein